MHWIGEISLCRLSLIPPPLHPTNKEAIPAIEKGPLSSMHVRSIPPSSFPGNLPSAWARLDA